MAVTILCHFHGLSGFLFGTGINQNFMQELTFKQQHQQENEKQKLKDQNNNTLELERDTIDLEEDDEEEEERRIDLNDENTFEFCDLAESNDSNSGKLNRTISNNSTSSASSCEIGIDTLLKEMKMIEQNNQSSISVSSTLTNILQSNSIHSGYNTISNSPISTSHGNCGNYLTEQSCNSSNCSSPEYSNSLASRRFILMQHQHQLQLSKK